MGRVTGPVLAVGVFIAWLALSYAPVSLPVISYGASGRWFGLLLVGGLAAFLGIQCWLIIASVRMFRPDGELQRAEARAEFRLSRRWEILWTVIPLAMTIALAVWSYPTWVSLVSR